MEVSAAGHVGSMAVRLVFMWMVKGPCITACLLVHIERTSTAIRLTFVDGILAASFSALNSCCGVNAALYIPQVSVLSKH